MADNFDMNETSDGRRDFLKKSALTVAALAAKDFIYKSASQINSNISNDEKQPWFKTITRWGQINITENDPQRYDITWWRKFWKRTETQGVIINAGGIVGYYPTKIPLHRQAEYLNGRDLFGELCKAAHDDGLAVFARMDSNRAHEDFYKAHPDWFTIDVNGNPYKAADLYISCINGPYYEQHLTSVLTEIATLYKPEGFTDNSWSGLGRDSICYCVNCKKSFHEKTGYDIPLKKNWNDKIYKQWIKWNYARRIEIWELNNKITKLAGGEQCIWAGMNSGSISGQSSYFRNFREIAKRADIIMLDDQARSDAAGFQHNAEMGKLIHGLAGWDKLIPESMAMYQAGRPNFRLTSKPKEEARMWMLNGIAGGIQPWWHMVSAYHEDRRMYHTPEPVFKWHKTNEAFLINRTPVANVGLVWSQDNVDFFGRDNALDLVEMPWRGMEQVLIRARIPFILIHADDIERDAPRCKTLLLPNLAVMSDAQVNAIKQFVNNGGNLLATGKTSLYDEWGDERNDYALADIFCAHTIKNNIEPIVPEEKMAGDAYHTYLRLHPELRANIEGPHTSSEPTVMGKRHSILSGFDETDILSFGGLLNNISVDDRGEVLMTFVPQFPVYPPEKAYMREPKTSIPGLIINTNEKKGRMAFLPADMDKQFGKFNLPDHGNLLANIIRWTVNNELPVVVEGAGLIGCQLYQQRGQMILHIINLTSAATWRAPLDELIAVGPFKVKIKLLPGVSGRKIKSLVSSQKPLATIVNGVVHFEVTSISDHEVLVIS